MTYEYQTAWDKFVWNEIVVINLSVIKGYMVTSMVIRQLEYPGTTAN